MPQFITLLAKIESLPIIADNLNISLRKQTRNSLKKELDARKIGGPGYVLSTKCLSNIYKLLVQRISRKK